MRHAACAAVGLAALLWCAADPATHEQSAAEGSTTVAVPDPDPGIDALARRAREQAGTAAAFDVPYRFNFRDRIAESGIRFVHRAVEESGRFYTPVHYDHGTGLAMADVDGDGLEDVYFVNQVGGSQLWKNRGDGTFGDITHEAGVALADRIAVAASFGDTDNDGDPDLFVTSVRGGNALFENDGQGRFRDISEAAGVGHHGHSSAAVFFDFDNDGLLDLYVCNVGRYTSDEQRQGGAYVGLSDAFSGHLHPERSEASLLYRNLGRNRFEDVTQEVGLGEPLWSGDAGVADLNGDGFLDLYVLNMQGGDRFYENERGRGFADRTQRYFPRTPWGSMGLKFFDYDGDGRPDLLVTDMHSDMSEDVGPDEEKLKSRMRWNAAFLQGDPASFVFGNALYRNAGSGRFEEVSDAAGVETYWPWGPSVGDLNADGWPDVFIAAGMSYPFRYGINSLLLNNRGAKFLDAEFLLGLEPRRGGRTRGHAFTVNCPAPHEVCAGRTGRVDVRGAFGSRSSVIFDLDGDGDLDLITNDFKAEPQVFVSDLADGGSIRWVRVALEGTVSNRNAIGATVRVVAGSRVQTQWVDGKSGYLSQSVMPLYFGLGDATAIDRVEVRWPSGQVQVLAESVRPNSTLRVTEPRREP